MLTTMIVKIVDACARRAWLVMGMAVLAAVLSMAYVAGHFAINTNSNDLISASLPWRQRQAAFDRLFVQRQSMTLVVIDAATPELATGASNELTQKLQDLPDLIKSASQSQGAFFEKNGLLFEPTKDVENTTATLLRERPSVGSLAAAPSLRGLMGSITQVLNGIRTGQAKPDDFEGPVHTLSGALDSILAGKPTFFSWQGMLSNIAPSPSELRKFIQVQPVLDFSTLEPGQRASDAIRKAADDLGLTSQNGVTVRLTGDVPLEDQEFATVREGAWLNYGVTVVVVLSLLYAALRSFRIVLAVFTSVFIGLAITAAVGLMMVHAFNLISIAFAVLFLGIGADFGIQFSVRYRAERHSHGDLRMSLTRAAARAGRPLALAAIATALGFYAFLPTVYKGVSELVLIAGTGMIIAFLATITVLPAVLTLLRPPPEAVPIGYAFLAPIDRFLATYRYPVVIGTFLAVVAASPLLLQLHFDFNPMNLRNKSVESVSTLLDLAKNPATTPNIIDVLAPSLDAAQPLAAKLAQLPEVDHVATLASFIPSDQPQKLALIHNAAMTLGPLLNPADVRPEPSDAEDVASLHDTADILTKAMGTGTGARIEAGRHFADDLRKLADGAPDLRARARDALLPPLQTMLDQLRNSLQASTITLDNLPPDLVRQWRAADGQARIEVAPKGDSNDNGVLAHFTSAIESVAPGAVGAPVAIQEAGDDVVNAFIQAGVWALGSIAILLFVVLRRITDVLLTLVPLLVAGIVTLELTVVVGLPLNFANIIALPLLLGLGVAFKIYFIMAWRAGVTNLLQSTLTRAVFFSALTTATAFGSLWFSNHPGTSSMGKLLALSLLCTLAAAVLFQPALMGPPRAKEGEEVT
jgi:uncharacterized protein